MDKLWIILILFSSLKSYLSQTGPGWCSSTTYSQVSYQEDCGSWKTDTCTRYMAQSHTSHFCCDGYIGAECEEDPCYSSIHVPQSLDRGVSCSTRTGTKICDRYLQHTWYKTEDNSTLSTIIPDQFSCNTVHPIWLNGTLPYIVDGIVNRTACVDYGRTDTCEEKLDIMIKNCSGFYVYYLTSPSNCDVAYCFGESKTCPLAAPSELILYNVVNDTIRGTEGKSLTINCTAIGGNPEPDLRLEIDSQVYAGKKSVHYTIPVLQRNKDKQLVKCQATSDALVSPLEKAVTLYLYLKPLVPVFNQDPPRTNDTQPLVVSCTSTGSRPAGAVINWKVNSTEITGGVVQQSTHDLSTDTYTVVSTLTYSVDRSYNDQSITCGVTHETLSQAIEATKTIYVYYAPDVTVSNKIYIQTDTTRTIQCYADGNPAIYTYYKWQHKSLYGVLIRELDGGQDGILTLPSVAESDRYQDTGEYICTVGNGIGDTNGRIKQLTGHGYLTINAQPVYTLDNDDISTQYGEFDKSTYVHMHVYSVPKYTQVTWSKENTQIPRNTKYDMTENIAPVKSSFHGVAVQLDGYDLTLTINNLVEGDFTTYRLMVSNCYGQIMEHSVLLESASAPQIPTNFSVTDSSVSSISLEWDPGFDGGDDQTFHVEYRISGSISWSTKEVPTKQQTGRQTFTLSGLEESTLYEVRMYAENKFNRSLLTYIESITTVQDNQTSNAPIGYVTGGLAAFIVVLGVTILVVFYLRKRGSVSRKQNRKSQRKEEAVYQIQLNSETYEQNDRAKNEIKDTSESKTEDERNKRERIC